MFISIDFIKMIAQNSLRESRVRVCQQLPHILAPTTAILCVRLSLRVGERAILHTQSGPRGESDGKLVCLQVGSDDLATESHVCFDRDE